MPPIEEEEDERRRHQRFLYSCEVTISPTGSFASHSARLLDLSSGGCLLKINLPVDYQEKMIVNLTLVSGDIAFRAVGSIRTRRDQVDKTILCGVLFVTLGTRGRLDLQDLIAELECRQADYPEKANPLDPEP